MCVGREKRDFIGGRKVFSVMWKIPCGDTSTIYMIYYNKICVLGSGCHLKLNVLLFFHSMNLMKMDVCGKLPYTAIYVVWKKLFIDTTCFTKEFVVCICGFFVCGFFFPSVQTNKIIYNVCSPLIPKGLQIAETF